MNQINNSNNILYQDSIPFFTTILDLKAYNNYEQGDVVEVGGRTSIGDGYGSKFIYDSTSTAFVDDENVVLPSNLPLNSSGRWLINGWAFLNDKMDADNKSLTGMTISSSTLTGSTITNSTLSNVTVPPTTDWTANTVVGALDINNKINNGLILKANLDGGNTLTGNQNITGNLTTTGTNNTIGTLQVSPSTGNSKATFVRKSNFTLINSYDGSNWHYLSINDDGTIDTEKGYLAFQSDVDTKANLAGGNTLTGDQKVSSGNVVVSQTDNSATTITKSLDTTTAGGILRYTDSSSANHDWVFGKTSITTPSGDTITGAGNYAVKDQDNNFTVDQTMKSIIISGGSNITFNDAAGASSTIYADTAGNNGDLVIRTGPSTAYQYVVFEPNGRIQSNAFGQVAMAGVTTTFTAAQQFSDQIHMLSRGQQSNQIWYTNNQNYSRSDDLYYDGTVNWIRSILYNASGSLVAYLQHNQAGDVWSNGGKLAFTTQLPFYGQNTSLRIQSFTTSAAIANGTVVSFPIAFTSIPQVFLQVINGGGEYGNTGIVNITKTGFTFQAPDSGQVQVLAVGTY